MALSIPTLRIYQPPKEGTAFQKDITERAVGYRRTKRDMGGDWDGSFLLYGDISELGQIFDTWCGFRLRETVGNTLLWKGIVWEMQLVHNGAARKRSVQLMDNYVYTTYIDTSDPPQIVTSSAVQNTESVAKHGRKEMLLLEDTVPQTIAEARRDTHLKKWAWPRSMPVTINLDRVLGDTYLEIFLAGDVWTANYRYESVSGLDSNQGAISYTDESGAETFTDDSQDFTDWQTTSGQAKYSIWVNNSDGSQSWGYLGAKVSNTEIRVYTDQALTTPGWNGDGDTTKTPSSYNIYGPVSEWIEDIVTNDCEFLNPGSIAQNLVTTHRETGIPRRAWDIMKSLTEMGDENGNPYRIYVDFDGYVHYEMIDTMPIYYLRDGRIYTSIGGSVEVNPWQLQPGVIRDLSYPQRQNEYTPWLRDVRDFYVSEWEVGVNFGAVPKTVLYDSEDILLAQMNYNRIFMQRRRETAEEAPTEKRPKKSWKEKLGLSDKEKEEWKTLTWGEKKERIRKAGYNI
jgi:hypothetical protein